MFPFISYAFIWRFYFIKINSKIIILIVIIIIIIIIHSFIYSCFFVFNCMWTMLSVSFRVYAYMCILSFCFRKTIYYCRSICTGEFNWRRKIDAILDFCRFLFGNRITAVITHIYLFKDYFGLSCNPMNCFFFLHPMLTVKSHRIFLRTLCIRDLDLFKPTISTFFAPWRQSEFNFISDQCPENDSETKIFTHQDMVELHLILQ